tara:strand:- start:189 stop:2729 length:2541 start_codon:yes stop_codon:yes gene_type:complete
MSKYKKSYSLLAVNSKNKYASKCGASGGEGKPGFQPGNTCGGDGDGRNTSGDQGGGDKPKQTPSQQQAEMIFNESGTSLEDWNYMIDADAVEEQVQEYYDSYGESISKKEVKEISQEITNIVEAQSDTGAGEYRDSSEISGYIGVDSEGRSNLDAVTEVYLDQIDDGIVVDREFIANQQLNDLAHQGDSVEEFWASEGFDPSQAQELQDKYVDAIWSEVQADTGAGEGRPLMDQIDSGVYEDPKLQESIDEIDELEAHGEISIEEANERRAEILDPLLESEAGAGGMSPAEAEAIATGDALIAEDTKTSDERISDSRTQRRNQEAIAKHIDPYVQEDGTIHPDDVGDIMSSLEGAGWDEQDAEDLILGNAEIAEKGGIGIWNEDLESLAGGFDEYDELQDQYDGYLESGMSHDEAISAVKKSQEQAETGAGEGGEVESLAEDVGNEIYRTGMPVSSMEELKEFEIPDDQLEAVWNALDPEYKTGAGEGLDELKNRLNDPSQTHPSGNYEALKEKISEGLQDRKSYEDIANELSMGDFISMEDTEFVGEIAREIAPMNVNEMSDSEYQDYINTTGAGEGGEDKLVMLEDSLGQTHNIQTLYDELDGTYVAEFRGGPQERMADGSMRQPLAGTASGATPEEAAQNVLDQMAGSHGVGEAGAGEGGGATGSGSIEEAFNLYKEDYGDDASEEDFNDAYQGHWEVEKDSMGREIPVEWAKDWVDQIGGVSEAISQEQIQFNTDYDKWNAELDNYGEGYAAEQNLDTGKWEVYDRQDADMPPTEYEYQFEAEDAAKEMNNEMLDDNIASGGNQPSDDQPYAEKYFDYKGWARDLVMGGEISVENGHVFWNR